MISIHVPLAGNVRRSWCSGHLGWQVISIHVPLAGNVGGDYMGWQAEAIFLSTFPLRGTSTLERGRMAEYFEISIHVPLAGNVGQTGRLLLLRSAFLSTFPLRGTSENMGHHCFSGQVFLSTFPLRGTSTRRCRMNISKK